MVNWKRPGAFDVWPFLRIGYERYVAPREGVAVRQRRVLMASGSRNRHRFREEVVFRASPTEDRPRGQRCRRARHR